MADTLLTVAKVLVIGTILVPCVVGLPAIFIGVLRDEWPRYRNGSRGTRNQSLIAVIVMVWLLIVVAVLYAAGAMKLWEEWHA